MARLGKGRIAELMQKGMIFEGPGAGRKRCNGCGHYIRMKEDICPACNKMLVGTIGDMRQRGLLTERSGSLTVDDVSASDASTGAPDVAKKLVGSADRPRIEALIKEGKVFREGGSGRKQCPSCEAFIYFQAAKCPVCEHVFPRAPRGSKATEAPKPLTFSPDMARLFKASLAYMHQMDNDAVRALAVLGVVEGFVDAAGGFENAKEAIKTIADHQDGM